MLNNAKRRKITNQIQSDSFSLLPPDIHLQILQLLSVVELRILRFVSKHLRLVVGRFALPRDIRFLTDYSLGEHIAAHGNLSLLKWFKSEGFPWGSKVTSAAAREGHLDIIEWALEEGCPYDESVCVCAAEGGYINILEWAKERDTNTRDSWAECSSVAAWFDQRHVIRWLYDHGYPWDDKITTVLASKGDLDTLKWVVNSGAPVKSHATYHALLQGHLHILKWLNKKKKLQFSTNHTYDELLAAERGYREIVKWMCQIKSFTLELVQIYASKGDLEMLGWISERISTKNTQNFLYKLYRGAAQTGQLEVIKWARERGYPWPPKYRPPLFDILCENNFHKIAIWIAENGCWWPKNHTLVKFANVELLEWAKQQGIEFDIADCISLALDAKNISSLKWLISDQPSFSLTPTLIDDAARKGLDDVLIFLIGKGCPWHPKVSLTLVHQKNFSLLKWALQNGCPPHPALPGLVVTYGFFELFQWLVEHGLPWNPQHCLNRINYIFESDNEKKENLVKIKEWILTRLTVATGECYKFLSALK